MFGFGFGFRLVTNCLGLALAFDARFLGTGFDGASSATAVVSSSPFSTGSTETVLTSLIGIPFILHTYFFQERGHIVQTKDKLAPSSCRFTISPAGERRKKVKWLSDPSGISMKRCCRLSAI